MKSHLTVAIETAREAGIFLKESLGKNFLIERKNGQETNIVTEIDKKSEAMIISSIRRNFPGDLIIAEESGRSQNDSETVWVVDPLDGTVNFTHGLKVFSVSIGVQRGSELIAGVVYDPCADEMFYAERGAGAFLNDRRIKVSTTDRLIESLLVTGFPYQVQAEADEIMRYFKQFLVAGQGIRRLGSAALDLAYVAAGRLDGYWETFLHPWDKAGGMMIVHEAGGIVTDFNGNAGNIFHPRTLASNGRIHPLMLEILQKSV